MTPFWLRATDPPDDGLELLEDAPAGDGVDWEAVAADPG